MTADPLAALKASFRIRSAEDANAIDAALDRDGMSDVEIERLVHRLAGSADLFGYPVIGAATRAIDAVFAEGRRPDVQSLRALSCTIRESLRPHS